MTTIAIIGALDDEVALIAASLNDVTHDRQAGLDVTRGTLGTNDGGTVTAVATVGGMGLVNAAATTQHLIDTYHPDAVIFSGIAGNLNRNLHINDVVLGGTLRYLDTDMRLVGQWKPGTEQQPVEEFHSDDRLLSLADQALAPWASRTSSASSRPATTSSIRRRRSPRSSTTPAPTPSRWKAHPWRTSPPETKYPRW